MSDFSKPKLVPLLVALEEYPNKEITKWLCIDHFLLCQFVNSSIKLYTGNLVLSMDIVS